MVKVAACPAIAERKLARIVNGVGAQTPLTDCAELWIRRGKRAEPLVIRHSSVGCVDVAHDWQIGSLRPYKCGFQDGPVAEFPLQRHVITLHVCVGGPQRVSVRARSQRCQTTWPRTC